MPTKQQEQFNELQRKNLEAAMRLAQLSIENSQRIMELQVQTARALFDEGVENAKALATTADPKQALTLRTHFAQSTTEKMLACARQIAEITSSTQAEVGRLVGQQLSTGGADMVESLQKMFQGMPIADSNALASVQTAMDTARAAFEQITAASQQAFSTLTGMAGAATGGKPKGKGQ